MKITMLLALAVVLAGCDANLAPELDQEKFRETFQECMRVLPAGPSSAHYNDWSDVIVECRVYAYNASAKFRR